MFGWSGTNSWVVDWGLGVEGISTVEWIRGRVLWGPPAEEIELAWHKERLFWMEEIEIYARQH
jgi:hypothetical protein